MDEITHRDAAEAVAVFRLQVLGALARRQLLWGDLRAELKKLSQQAFMAPGEEVPKRFSVTTLERWYYALRKRGLAGLRPKVRDDRGRARALTEPQRQLFIEIRREYPRASVSLILSTLLRDGRLEKSTVSPATIRRFYAQEGLDRTAAVRASKGVRHRWQAGRKVTVARTLLDVNAAPWIEYAEKSYPLCLVDPVFNSRRKRQQVAQRKVA